MLKNKMKKSAILLTIAAITAGATMLIFAQNRTGGFAGKNGEMIRKFVFNRISDKLNLNNDQQAQAKTVLETARTNVQPLIEQLKNNHQQSKNLGTDGVYNDQKAQELADKQTQIIKQLIVEKEKTKAKLFAILTPEQREQAKQLVEDFEAKIKNRGLEAIIKGGNFLSPDDL